MTTEPLDTDRANRYSLTVSQAGNGGSHAAGSRARDAGEGAVTRLPAARRLNDALGPLGDEIDAGQIYVTLGRLREGRPRCHRNERVGLGTLRPQGVRPDGRGWGTDRASGCTRSTGRGPDLAEFHLKLVTAAAARLADPIAIVGAQRRELLRRLRAAQRAALEEPAHSAAGLLLEGIVLRLQADLRWLETCEREWTERGDR